MALRGADDCSAPMGGHWPDDLGSFGAFAAAEGRRLIGDPYGELHSVTRGVTFAVHGGGFGELLGCGYAKDFEHHIGAHGPWDPALHLGSTGPWEGIYGHGIQQQQDGLVSEKTIDRHLFSSAHLPPAVPQDPLHPLEATTMRIRMARNAPWEIGSAVVAFFDTAAGLVSGLKVNYRKYTVKATCFRDGYGCTMKTRLYAEADGRLTLEVHRCAGDAAVLHAVFQEAAKFLRRLPCCLAVDAEGAASQPVFAPPLPPPEVLAVDADFTADTIAEEVAPLLDMAAQADSPSVQAEAARGLAAIARNAGAAFALGSEVAFRSISALLFSSQVQVLLPTSQLLLRLAGLGPVASRFAKDGLLMAMLSEVCSANTCELLKVELAEVVRTALQQCTGQLASEHRRGLSVALADAQPLLKGFPHAAQTLREASRHLSQAKGSAGLERCCELQL